MTNSITTQIITPEKILFEGEAAYVQIPGAEGEFGVLTGHAPTVAMLQPGIVGVELENGEKREFAISGGVAEIVPERCTLLVETA
jgi:F-type H+-transporting ATPase subunit epsilon